MTPSGAATTNMMAKCPCRIVIVESSRLHRRSTSTALTAATIPGRSTPNALKENSATALILPHRGARSRALFAARDVEFVPYGRVGSTDGRNPMERFTVAGMFRANVAAFGNKPMFRYQDQTTTWSDHFARACAVAHALTAEGLGPGDRVAFLDRNGLAYFEVLFGGALMGAVNVAVNWRLAPIEMAAVIDDCRARRARHRPGVRPVLGEDGEWAAFGATGGRARRPQKQAADCGGASDLARRVGYEDWLADRPADDPGHQGEPGEVSLQLYTSGTTGTAEGGHADQRQHGCRHRAIPAVDCFSQSTARRSAWSPCRCSTSAGRGGH